MSSSLSYSSTSSSTSSPSPTRKLDYSGLHRVVVIGGCGFVGRELVRLLIEMKACSCIRVVDNKPMPVDMKEWLFDEQSSGICASFHMVDIRKLDAISETINGADTVFHLASVVDVGLNKNPHIYSVNVDGTKNIIDACLRHRVLRLIYTSTMDVVYDGRIQRDGDETLPYPRKPFNDYIHTKIIAEKLVLEANGAPHFQPLSLSGPYNTRTSQLLTCAIRPCLVYGPHDPHAIKTVIEQLKAGCLPCKLGDGKAQGEFVFVGNVAYAHILAAQHMFPGSKVCGYPYFVTENNRLNYWEFFDPYVRAKGFVLPSLSLPSYLVTCLAAATEWLHSVLSRCTNKFDPKIHRFVVNFILYDHTFISRKASEDFGYSPMFKPEEGLRRTLEWLLREDI